MFLLQWYLVLVAGSVVGPIVGSKDGEVFKTIAHVASFLDCAWAPLDNEACQLFSIFKIA